MTETEFLAQTAQRSGCQLLLDVNNVAVSCFNLGTLPADYISRFPGEAIGQIHLAGYSTDRDATTPLRIDSHNQTVAEDVWQLYETSLAQWGDHPTLIEWDADIPALSALQAQAHHADQLRRVACE